MDTWPIMAISDFTFAVCERTLKLHKQRKQTRKQRRFYRFLVFLLYYSHLAKATLLLNGFMTLSSD